MIIKDILRENQDFRFRDLSDLKHSPKLCIITCMDSRLIDLLERALGIGRGDAKVIKNAGNIVDDGVIRSAAVAIYALGDNEIIIVGHTDCGMARLDEDLIVSRMRELGVEEEVIENFSIDVLNPVGDEEENVIEGVKRLKSSPLIPESIGVHGLIIDINTGRLKPLYLDE
uniref:BETA-CARBONIC ANHYDRASE n=1 Tax=Methanothermobacter thermautotrophicus TaxID=145262 RepID=UPI0000112FFF|nr:Chain A, BETA-CARBONIC ANHYDRASE [Methanothermobacter thermautotrophicus]1G5C_B Chain B, BETA-CARBONIC ANHYDRASE [Methanothermobacter thermautotrophicus]1G5C_C Chain C, BETA-CARBONIC ANHYDRASE [Methanothermobacter thermautotrophicus]1G5C_D Chain D, BETA-CARBONIC ANHYDRASE [Methanothermobacter thermautotrophicus]1G5C_E Chain E, BETA-CARBONIC ANHYDRASE [Methanothermobacter thermautotrophicus]1G5C_F Chain F, BETA-CARBONIC ANHYDRASE [Methanothermobacter thermautotrophicus]